MRPFRPATRLALAAMALSACAALAQAPTKAAPSTSRVVQVDRIVAVVNDEVITYNDLNERVNLVTRQIQRQGGQVPGAEALSRQILERLINDLVQVQLAKDTGI
jgi:peptidyl-prolyl cis-trans isomerase SurA